MKLIFILPLLVYLAINFNRNVDRKDWWHCSNRQGNHRGSSELVDIQYANNQVDTAISIGVLS